MRLAAGFAIPAIVFSLASCGSSTAAKLPGSSSGVDSSSSTARPNSNPGSATESTKAPASGSSANDFCNRLALGVDRLQAYAKEIRTNHADFIAKVTAENKAVLAAAPSELHDALATINTAAEKTRAISDPSASTADRATASKALSAFIGQPQYKAAGQQYKTWVKTNCGALAPKILLGQ